MSAVKDIVLENIIFTMPEFIPHFSVNMEYIVVEICVFGPAVPIRTKDSINITTFGDVENIVIDFCVPRPTANMKNAGPIVLADIVTDDCPLTADVS